MTTTDEAAPAAATLTFRPDIEGLRAVAVGLVVLLHAGLTVVSGGYVGVDVFFVISGFLITSLLLDEVAATGRVSILRFYARRARRILPVGCFVIAATVVVAYLQLGPLVGRSTSIDGRWAAGFAANFRFTSAGTDYFAKSLPPSPLQHYWSLAVEEQFYFVWPTLLLGLVMLGRRLGRTRLTLRIGLGAVMAASLYWSVEQTASDATAAYFSPFTRAWELGAGAAIAVFSVAIARTPAPLRAAATWVGLALVAVAAFTFTARTRFPGHAAALPVAGTALVIAGGIGRPTGAAEVVLGLAPMRFVGKISYSLYLWHWPVLVIAEQRSPGPLTGGAKAACVAVAVALSVGTYSAIERPLKTTGLLKARDARTDWQRSRRALALGAAAILVAVAVSAYTNDRAVLAINDASESGDTAGTIADGIKVTDAAQQVRAMQRKLGDLVAAGLELRTVPRHLDPPVLQLSTAFDLQSMGCMQRDRTDVTVRTCTLGSRTSRETLVLFGDSHAMEWTPALDRYGKVAGYRIVTVYKAECPVPVVTAFAASGSRTGAREPYPECERWRADAFRRVARLAPAAVVIAFGQGNSSPTGIGPLAPWRAGFRRSVQSLQASGARVIEIGNNPSLPKDPSLCLSGAGADPSACTGRMLDPVRSAAEREDLQALGGAYVDVEPWLCNEGRCPLIIGDRIAYANNGHVSAQFVTFVEPLLAAGLRAAGLR